MESETIRERFQRFVSQSRNYLRARNFQFSGRRRPPRNYQHGCLHGRLLYRHRLSGQGHNLDDSPQERGVKLIDDSKFQRRANELAVSRSGYSVLIAEDGDQGLQMARDKVPDVIVLDMMLPKLSGPELLHALKDDARTARIPIIVLSSLPQSNEARLLSEGAAAYLEKANLGIETGSAALIQSIASVLGHPSR